MKIMAQLITGRKLPMRLVCDRYSVTDKTIERWEHDPKLGFPQAERINNRKYFDEEELTTWDRKRTAAEPA